MFANIICVFASFMSIDDTPLIAALVAQKMNAGVSTTPCGVFKRPLRARDPSIEDKISNEKLG